MKVYVLVAADHALEHAIRAALPETDLLLREPAEAEAERRLITLHPDAIFIDDTPALGVKALARLRACRPDIPVVMLCGRGDVETRANHTLAGANACIVKPFSCEELTAALDRVFTAPRREPPRAAYPPVESFGVATVNQHQTALRWLSRISAYIERPDQLHQSLVDALMDVFGAARCAVLHERDGVVAVCASHGLPDAITGPLRLGFATGLMRWFEENLCLFDRVANRHAEQAAKEMHVMGARVGAPLISGGRVRGALLLGERASGLDYGPEERELLTVFARCVSNALENTRLYGEATRQQARMDTILAHVTAGVVAVSSEKTVIMMNQSAERILQIRAVDALGRSVQRLGSGIADVVLRAMEAGRPLLRQEITDRATGARLGLSATPMGVEGAVVVFSVLPEEEAKSEDIAYSPFWEFLATRVAQEIKNPMVAINTFAQLLPRKYDSEDFRESFREVVTQEVARINRVVETLFDFARRPRLILDRVSVNDTVRNVLGAFEEELANRAIQLETEWCAGDPKAEVDTVYFAQALHNVVQNSIEAMPKGGSLRVTTRETGGQCEIIISDTGPGVSGQDASQIFLPFYSTKEQGMGLGLTIASRIMREHRGELSLAPNEAGGGAFRFQLPAVETAHADDSGR